jgi:hypothetical protein
MEVTNMTRAAKRPGPSANAQTQAVAQQQPVDQAVQQHRPAPDESREQDQAARRRLVRLILGKMGDALEQTQDMRGDSPRDERTGAKKRGKVAKAKRVRDSFTMPDAEYVQIGKLKKRLGGVYRKSELLRAGIAVLRSLDDVELRTVMAHFERVVTARK